LKLIPNDATIKEFSKFLPTEIEYQKDAEEEAEANKVEYYDEEVSDEEEAEDEMDEPPQEEAKVYEIKAKKEGESTAAESEFGISTADRVEVEDGDSDEEAKAGQQNPPRAGFMEDDDEDGNEIHEGANGAAGGEGQ